jgi:hypothetical protein
MLWKLVWEFNTPATSRINESMTMV